MLRIRESGISVDWTTIQFNCPNPNCKTKSFFTFVTDGASLVAIFAREQSNGIKHSVIG